MIPVESVKCYHEFHYLKFKDAIVNLELFAILIKKIAFQQLQSELRNEFDSSSFELKV